MPVYIFPPVSWQLRYTNTMKFIALSLTISIFEANIDPSNAIIVLFLIVSNELNTSF